MPEKISREEWQEMKAVRQMMAEARRREEEAKLLARDPVAWGYRRCSHPDSAESGLGLDEQDNAIRLYHQLLNMRRRAQALNELPLEHVFSDEAVSAWSKRFLSRPAASELHTKLREGDHIIFARLDRAFRDLEDQIAFLREMERKGVFMHFVQEQVDASTAFGRFTLNVLGATNQLHSDRISEQNKAIMRRLREQGRAGNGNAPRGFKLVKDPKTGRKKMVIDYQQRQVMAEIVRVKDEQGWDWKTVSDYIEQKLAAKEEREPIPAWRMSDRKWSAHICKVAYKQELLLREKAQQAKEEKEAKAKGKWEEIVEGRVDEGAGE